MTIDLRTLVAIVAALIAAASFAFTIWYNRKNQEYARLSVALANFNMKQARRESLRAWATECMSAMSTAYVFLKTGKPENGREDILIQLTSQIDCGRWLLPNNEHVSFGKNKESAYTGFRQLALDDLVDVYNILDKVKTTELPSALKAVSVMESKRRFTSAIQEKLEPRAADADFDELSGALK